MHFQLAWRNIWRNPRRTAVIMVAVVMGVWSMIFLGSLMRGMMVGMVKNRIATLTGDIQIHHKGYRNDPGVENSITSPEEIIKVIEKILPPGSRWASRVRVNAIASNARHSAAVTLVGIDPGRESRISFIGKAVKQGQYLTPGDRHGILVGKSFLDKFETRIGNKLVLMSQGSDLEIASRAFRIVGVFHAEMQSTEKQFVFINRSAAQQMLKLNRAISEISILLPEHENNEKVSTALRSSLPGNKYEVQTWQDLLPIVVVYLKMYEGFIFIWYLVVFIAMGFGIVNTMLMAIFERVREFGLLKALGMKPWWVIRSVLTEVLILLVIGMTAGNILGFMSIFGLSHKGIDLSAFAAGTDFVGITRVIYPAFFIKDILVANLTVLLLGLLVCLYPAVKAARFTPVEALAHN